MVTKKRSLKVFLCYSKDDKPKVRELYYRLTADGFDAWLNDEKLMPGQDWDLEIRREVKESDAVIVCLSNSSITKSGYVQKEIRLALDIADEQPEGEIFIIPLRLEECIVPDRLKHLHWVDLFLTKSYEKLKHSLEFREKSLASKGISLYRFFEPQTIRIPAGRFLMGSTPENATKGGGYNDEIFIYERECPQHFVDLSDYFIGKYPVTNKEYSSFIQDAEYKVPENWKDKLYPPGKDNHPVVYVSWNDAIKYCKWLSKKTGKNYRLPTEAEWEKAARGVNGRLFPWGNTFNPKYANTIESRIRETTSVGKFSPRGDSPYGCADTIGNVWEWCRDWFAEDVYKDRENKILQNPKGPAKGMNKVVRGGSYYSHRTQCAYRAFSSIDREGSAYGGFRIARSAED